MATMQVSPQPPRERTLTGSTRVPTSPATWSTAWPEYFDIDRPVSFNAELADRFDTEMAADLAAMEAAGLLTPPDDLCSLDDPDDSGAVGAPRFVSEEDLYDDLPPMSAVDALEWELWAGVDQDEAERAMLRRNAPNWVFLPPGAALAAALEPVRPQHESPIALIELMKAAGRMSSWAESIKIAAIASFWRQRRAQHADQPRPRQIDNSGRPIDPERSWAAEIGAALHLSTDTAGRHIDTALHLTGALIATHTALKTGALTWSKALSISEATRSLPDAAAQAVESHVLRRASSQTHANLRRSLRKQVAKHAAATEAERHRDAIHHRTCKIVPLSDGMAGLWVVHTADKIQEMWVVVQALADLAKRPTPTTPPTPANTPPAPTPGPTTTPSDPTAANAPPAPATPAPATPAPDRVAPDRIASDGAAASGSSTEPGTPGSSAPNRTAAWDNIAASGSSTTPGTPDSTAPDGTAALDSSTELGTPGSSAPNRTAAWDNIAASGSTTTRGTPGSSISPECTTASTPGDKVDADADAGSRSRDERTAEQRRADVVADLFEQLLHNGIDWLGRRLPDQHRRRPHIEVLIPANTLLGLDNDPCELTGYGPIPADMARRIAADGTWRRLLTDPTNGVVLEASTHRHDPSALISETLLARHPTCAWPGCNRAARECDRDHGTPFTRSGRTNLSGLAPYCEYHHVIKDTPDWGWTTTNHPDGSITLIAPTGHRYTTVPPARGPITHHPTTNQQPPPHPNPSAPSYFQESPGLQRPGTEQVHRTHATDPAPF